MGAVPKPPAQRVRRNAGHAGWRTLPAAEPFTPPAAGRGWLESTKAWWATLWASPMATTYQAADVPVLVRLGEMVDARARGTLGATETVAMTALEDRFGLSPKARRALQWEISQAEQPTPLRPVNVPKLTMVDGDDAA
jgi:hypothetical protein